jgi:trimeric autotransporter adhesin
MIKYNGGLIAAGSFNYIDSTSCNNIAFWNGYQWFPLGNGLEYTGATTVSTLAVYQNELYAAGSFTLSGSDTVNNIAKWNGTEWTSLGVGINGTVKNMCVFDSGLYVGGSFTEAGGIAVNNIVKWNGSNWSAVGNGLEYTGATTVSTLQAFNGNLFAGGNFDIGDGNSIGFIAKWNGTEWAEPGDGLKYTGATTVSTVFMYEYDKKLIIGAKYANGDEFEDVFYAMQTWNDSTWETMDANSNSAVYTMANINGKLYAGGAFTQISTSDVEYIAIWQDEKRAYPINFNETETYSESNKIKYAIYPNPVHNEVNIRAERSDLLSDYKFTLTDVCGREIFTQYNSVNKISLQRESVGSGVYIYMIIDNKGMIIQKGKLLFD